VAAVKKRSLIARWLCLLVTASCASGCGATPVKGDINRVVDDWHDAAAKADAARYFGHMAPGSVFIGTDATERWTKSAFEAFARPYFAKGKAWTMLPQSRHVALSPDGGVAWFDEKLRHTKYGDVRGSGVLRRVGGAWRIVHYVLSFPVPNGVSKRVIALIREQDAKTAPATK